MPAPVRYRSTAAVYDDGRGGQRHHPGARQPKRAPAPEFGHWFDRHAAPPFRHCRSKCVHLAPAAGWPAAGRGDHGRGSAAVNPAFTATRRPLLGPFGVPGAAKK